MFSRITVSGQPFRFFNGMHLAQYTHVECFRFIYFKLDQQNCNHILLASKNKYQTAI